MAAATPESLNKFVSFCQMKDSKYSLLKNQEDLNEEQMNKLNQVQNVSPTLKAMYELKEKIRNIFNRTKDWYPVVFKLGILLSKAKNHFPTSYNTIIRWFDEVIAYFDHRTNSGIVEGINNKIKLIKRSAFGFINFDISTLDVY
ncbi:transposase [Nodularia spumigena]|uniref:transposase n=1 Tax=Nodularia spumigena TaxID=70799 RepID=UPI00232AFC6C|nr:transposase [Nodularia spumigena]MDB9303056.1 transposase [Nodularia spumigena CS-591/12]MDB9319227.1 transposase [Nodularia spumigena CS-590/01A]MDB9323909.1 transposase [Nodularia spumigena CS-591/07A]MDB9328274.1 transposase [Nodularia spumigena CS-590/02]MDB9333094.1 transposase [Nodularia spumigena CS-591/04]